MLEYYRTVKNKNGTKHEYIVLKEVYNICISANIFRPIVAADIYKRYNPKSVLDFTAGWGGRMVGACAVNVPKYTGIEINNLLKLPYDRMITDLKEDANVCTDLKMFFQDALTFDYSSLEYDLVLTSPPYYSIEKYPGNKTYNSKSEMNELFYVPLFSKTFQHLQKGGYYCLNVNLEIYISVCVPLLGEATEQIPLKKSKRQNDYKECIYVWKK
jgi:tRNA1(Val) A37 N6-methylase TrmN6